MRPGPGNGRPIDSQEKTARSFWPRRMLGQPRKDVRSFIGQPDRPRGAHTSGELIALALIREVVKHGRMKHDQRRVLRCRIDKRPQIHEKITTMDPWRVGSCDLYCRTKACGSVFLAWPYQRLQPRDVRFRVHVHRVQVEAPAPNDRRQCGRQRRVDGRRAWKYRGCHFGIGAWHKRSSAIVVAVAIWDETKPSRSADFQQGYRLRQPSQHRKQDRAAGRFVGLRCFR